jgi:enamine deaminase RidA (YjgF/YER057c/UK114 family)
MKTQAHAGLQNLKNDLAAAGLTFKDVVFLRAFVGPDKPGAPDARYDLANWNAAYDEFFNNAENPHKPLVNANSCLTNSGTVQQC